MLDQQYDGTRPGYVYSREGHGNADVVAARLDRMEGAPNLGVMTSSGMAAVATVMLGLLRSGDHVIGANQLYGRSMLMMTSDLPRLGIETTLVDPSDVDAVAAAIRPETKMILIEVVSNPTLRMADLDGIAELTQSRGITLVVDNTFTTPLAIRPLERGAEIVLHSVTKLLAGHSDVMLGYASAKDPDQAAQMRRFAITSGAVASPFDCWLAERGMLSFDLRFERAQANATALAEHLSALPGVKRVIYPGRDDHPDHALAARLLAPHYCNMVSFELEGGRSAANAFVAAADGLAFAPTLGDVGTTLSHPVTSSHREVSQAAREAIGITEGFFRVSVGIEPIDALRAVFERAVSAAL